LILLLEPSLGKVPTLKPTANLSLKELWQTHCTDEGAALAEGQSSAKSQFPQQKDIAEPKQNGPEQRPPDSTGKVEIVIGDGAGQATHLLDSGMPPREGAAKMSNDGAVGAAESGANSSKAQALDPIGEVIRADANADMADLRRKGDEGHQHKAVVDGLLLGLFEKVDNIAKVISRCTDEWQATQACSMALVKDQVTVLKDIASGQSKWTQAVSDQLVMLTINSQVLPRLLTNVQRMADLGPAALLSGKLASTNGLLAVPGTPDPKPKAMQDAKPGAAQDVQVEAPAGPSLVAASRCATLPENLRLPLCEPPSLPNVQYLSDFGRNAQQTLRSAQAPMYDAAVAQRQRFQSLCTGQSATSIPQPIDPPDSNNTRLGSSI